MPRFSRTVNLSAQALAQLAEYYHRPQPSPKLLAQLIPLAIQLSQGDLRRVRTLTPTSFIVYNNPIPEDSTT